MRACARVCVCVCVLLEVKRLLVILFLNETEPICFHIDKWFQVLRKLIVLFNLNHLFANSLLSCVAIKYY